MDTFKDKDLEKELRKKLSEEEMDVDPQIWENVYESVAGKKTFFLYERTFIKYLVAASIGLLIVISGINAFNGSSKESTSNTPKLVYKPEETVEPQTTTPQPANPKPLVADKIEEPIDPQVLAPDKKKEILDKKPKVEIPKKEANKPSELIAFTTVNAKKEFFLPDSTKVKLNRNSKLVITEFSHEVREVELTGEAFFEVKPDINRPFKVVCGKSLTEVLGTSFNIKQVFNTVELYVEEGKVRFSHQENPEEMQVLTKNEFAKLEQNKVSKMPINDTNYLCWNTDTFVFIKSTPLSEVLPLLEKHYNIEVTVDDPSILNCHLKGRFKKMEAEMVISTLASMLNFKVEKDKKNKYHLSGKGCE